MDYDITIRIDGDEDMLEINIQQRGEDSLCYGGTSRKDLVNNTAGALEEFLHELETGEIPTGEEETKVEEGEVLGLTEKAAETMATAIAKGYILDPAETEEPDLAE